MLRVYVPQLGDWSLPLRLSVPWEDTPSQATILHTTIRFSLAARDLATSNREVTNGREIVPAQTYDPEAKSTLSRATVVVFIHPVGNGLERRPIVPHDPMSAAMRERKTVTRSIFRQLVDALATGEEDESPRPKTQVRRRPGESKNRVSTIPNPE